MGTLHIPFCRGWRWVDGTSLVSPEGEVASERSPSFPHWPECCTREDRCRLLEVIPTPWAPWPYFCLSWVLSQKRTHTEWCLQPSWICLCCHDNSESCSCSLSLCSFHRLQSSLSLFLPPPSFSHPTISLFRLPWNLSPHPPLLSFCMFLIQDCWFPNASHTKAGEHLMALQRSLNRLIGTGGP